VVDNTAPNVATVGAPTEGAVVSGNVDIAASAADATSPIASVQFRVRGSAIGTDTTAPYSLSWNSTTGADGSATIEIVVTDMAGNSATSPVRTVTVDNGAPTPALADPGQNLSGSVVLSASSDPDTVEVDFQRAPAGSGSWTTIAADTIAPYGVTFDTTTLTDGVYDFRVVATDGIGNIGTSPVRSNVRIDNTSPSGELTAPAAGTTVGGPNVQLASSAADAGSGVASVAYEVRPTGGSFTTVATSTASPFDATWDATGLASGNYDLRPVVTDRAGNSYTGATVTVNVDATAPTVSLADPGAELAGAVTLAATVTGSGATQVAFSISSAGANAWQPISTDSAAPWSVSFDTATVTDGLYDLRAVVSDGFGNTNESVRAGVRIDNTAPLLLSSTPADGTRVDTANSIELVANEAVTATNVTLDGAGTVTPVVTGTHVVYNTGALGIGNHTLAGDLRDGSGKITPFRVHFTVWVQGSAGVAPLIEKNTKANAATTLMSADGVAAVTMPADAWSPRAADWVVLRIRPLALPTVSNGFAPSSESLDVSAYWALAGDGVHRFARPLEIGMQSSGQGLVPATLDNGVWRVLRRVPNAPDLPDAWDDGFYRDGAGFHLLTRHLSQFALLRDVQAPAAPSSIRGIVKNGRLSITWVPGADNSGTYDYVRVMVDGVSLGDFGPDRTGVDAGPYRLDSTIALRETDLAGNDSSTATLRRVPPITGDPLGDATATLEAAGFFVGNVTEGGTGTPGTVTGPSGLVLADDGSPIDLTVAPGSASKFVFSVVNTKKLRMPTQRRIAARIMLTRRARVTASLFSPRHVKLYTWRFSLRAGRSIVKMRLPKQVRRPGEYSLRWTAQSGHDHAARTIRVQLRRRGAAGGRQPLEVVLAGSQLPQTLPVTGTRSKVVAASGEDHTFELAGADKEDVRVIVVDVDQFGVSFVRDLHTVFPNVKIVAVARRPRTLAAALKAGATVALPSSTPSSVLATVVSKLLKRP
jgi:chitinase